MTNEEIWEMLKPKMEKNGLTYLHYGYNGDGKKFFYYKDSDVINAIAVAYRSGYERCMKGRPFKIGEKKNEEKKGGCWEPIDPNNLPKEGTKVRCARKFSDDIFNIVSIGTEGIVEYFGEFFGVKFNETYFCSCEHPDRFDMWVEDDE